MLPLLHDVQDALGYVPADSVPLIAEGLGLSRAEVHGVISYYHFFRSTPPGRTGGAGVPRRGLPGLRLGRLDGRGRAVCWAVRPTATRADGAVSLEPVYCLGLCASSPAIQINDRVHARVTPERLARLVSDMAVQP